MAWIDLTSQHFEDGLLATELRSLNAVKAREGRTAEAQLVSLLAAACNTVRGYCPRPQDRGEGLTIPDEMISAAVSMARNEFFAAFPELKGLWTEARDKLYLQGIRRLERWSEDKYYCAPAETPAPPSQQAAGATVKNLGPKRANRF